jgi:hypothetical protein
MAELLSNLSYSRPVPQYVSPPISTLKENLAELKHDFDTNRQNADAMEIAIANLDLLEDDEPHRAAAMQRVKDRLKEVTENGDWENAGTAVRQAAKEFGTDSAILGALQAKKQRATTIEALQKRVGDKDNPLLQSDVDWAIAEGDKRYGGQKLNEETGRYSGVWGTTTPPKYIDKGTYVDDFLTGFKPDQHFGEFTKGQDGKWYKTKTQVTPGGYEIAVTTEQAEYKELYQAAKSHLMQNKEAMDRLEFEMRIDTRTMDDMKAADPGAREAMIKDLVEIAGYKKADLNNMSDERVLEIYKKESNIHQSISGAVAKHSYTKEEVQSFGLTLEAQMKRDAAKRKEEEEETEALRIVMQTKGITFVNPFGYADNMSGHSEYVRSAQESARRVDSDLSKLNVDIDAAVARLVRSGMSKEDALNTSEVKAMQVKADQLMFTRNSLQFGIEEAEKRVDRAVKSLVDRGEIKMQDYQQYKDVINSATPEDVKVAENFRRVVVDGLKRAIALEKTERGKAMLQEHVDIIQNENLLVPAFDKASYIDALRNNFLKGNLPNSIITADEKKQIDSYKDYFKKVQDKLKDNKAVAAKIDKELSRQNKETVIETSYAEIGLGNGDKRSEWANKSRFATQVEASFLGNPEGWTIFDQNGRRLYDDRPTGWRNADVESLNVVGLTTEPVGAHGYLVPARIRIPEMSGGQPVKDKQGKVQYVEEFVYMQPSAGYDSNFVEAAKDEILSGNMKLMGTDAPGAAQTAIDLARKWDKYLIDSHMARFNDHPIQPNQGVTKKVPLGYGGMFAEITRETGSYVGNVVYKTRILDPEGKVVPDAMYGQQFHIHKDKFTLEADLEAFQGQMFTKRYGTATRADRHNNPTAMTTAAAKNMGLVEGVDYTVGDRFTSDSGKEYFTAKFLGDPVATSIRAIDKGTFSTTSGNRWSYLDGTKMNAHWKTLSTTEKAVLIDEMRKYENGQPNNLRNIIPSGAFIAK